MSKLNKSVLDSEDIEKCKECASSISKSEHTYNDGFCNQCLKNYYEEFGEPKE